ncbi:MAG: MBL fold metallo-hydrolase [Acidobacteriota bacterium]
MSQAEVYLKSNVVAEPLVDRWYAWSHAISPATAAMNIVGRHLAIMESYVRNPQVHTAAVKNAKMRGGPFIDYPRPRVAEVKDLIARTKRDRAQMISFAEDIKKLDDMLRKEAVGYSLQPLYEKIPEGLRGYVELTYDLNNHPSFRVIEPLLYRSPLYEPSSQSMMLSLIDGDERPFILSTPRIQDEGDVHLEIPFADRGIDELFEMKKSPRSLGYIKERLGVNGDGELFESFFTTREPPKYNNYEGEGMRWRYFGHACILLEARGVSILLDPILSYTYENDVSRYTYEDLPDRIDYVLITHNHQDHILFETMLQIRHKIGTVVVPRSSGGSLQDPSLKHLLEKLGFDDVRELEELDSIEIEGGEITGLPFFGEHGDLDIRSKLAYFVRLHDHTLMFAADSCNIEPVLYEKVHQLVGDVEVLFVGMECDGAPMSWVYGPLLTRSLDRKMDQSRRLAGSNFERAGNIVRCFNCKEVYVYAMGQEPWLDYITSIKYTPESNPIVASEALLEECKNKGLVAERLFGEKSILLG